MPTLELFTSSDIFRQNVNALHDAKKNFIKAESIERINRTLWHNVRTYCEENYQNGDKVFHKRRAVKGWKGPAALLGKERNFVVIQLSSAFYRCHPCHLMKATQQKFQTTLDVKPVNKDNRYVRGKLHKEKEYSSSDDTEDDSDKEEENTSKNEIKKEVYEEDDRSGVDSSNKTVNQIDVEKNDDQEQHTPVSSVENAENDQKNGLVHQDIQRLKDVTSRPKSEVMCNSCLRESRKYRQKFCLNSQSV